MLERMWKKFAFPLLVGMQVNTAIMETFRMDWLDLLAVQGTLNSLLQHHSSKASILWHSAFFTVQLKSTFEGCYVDSASTAQHAVAAQHVPVPPLSPTQTPWHPRVPPGTACLSSPAVPVHPRPVATHTMATLLPSMTTRRSSGFPGSSDRSSSKGVFRAS